MKTMKSKLDSMFAILDNEILSKNKQKKEGNIKGNKKKITKLNSDSNVPTETYTAK